VELVAAAPDADAVAEGAALDAVSVADGAAVLGGGCGPP
jgi:hypothetical protein